MSSELQTLEGRLQALGTTPSRERVDALNELAWNVGFHDIPRTESLAREATEMARTLGYSKGIAWGLLNAAYGDYFAADYEKALEKGREALERFEEIGETMGVGNAAVGLGLVFWSLGDFEQAISNFHRGIEIFREHDAAEREAWGLNSLGGVLESIGDLPKAAEHHLRALALFRSTGNRVGEGRALTGLGSIHQRQGQLDKALEYHLQSLELARESKHPVAESRALNDIGTLYRAVGDLELAEKYLLEGLAIRKRTGHRPAAITSHLDLGKLFTEKRDLERAFQHLNEALDLATRTGTKPKVFRAHEALSAAYEAAGDYRAALEHYRRFQTIKEEVLGEEAGTKLRNFQIQLESRTVEKLKQAQAKLIQAARMATLGQLVAGIAHEVNTPVGVIRASVDVAERALGRLTKELEKHPGFAEVSESARVRTILQTLSSHRDAVASAARRLQRIVGSLKRLTNLDQAERQVGNLHESLETLLALLEPQWMGRIRVERRFGELPPFEGYYADLNQAFLTLLVNASEAIEGEGTIVLSTSYDGERIRLETRDTGRGIAPELLSTIFDVNFTRRGSRIGLHVGLAHVKATVEKHGGEIEVTSEPGQGTEFVVTLPAVERPALP